MQNKTQKQINERLEYLAKHGIYSKEYKKLAQESCQLAVEGKVTKYPLFRFRLGFTTKSI